MKKIITLLLIGIGIYLCKVDIACPENNEPELRNIFIARQEALKRKDYARLWEFYPEYEKVAHFKNNIEEMKIHLESQPADGFNSVYQEKITKITFITPSRVYVETDPPPPFGGYYLVKEDGKWTFDFFSHRYNWVLAQLRDIGRWVMSFYEKYKRWPKDMEEIIEFDLRIKNYSDLFDAENKPYRFIATAKGWKLYSLGPDSKDDKGEVVYNQAKGLFSAGDMVLTEKDIK